MNRFQDKNVLVTGGNSGIGLAAAQAFAAEGARVVITGRDRASLDTAATLIGPQALAVSYDAAQPDSARSLTDAIAAKGIRLDVAFMNAGVAKFAAFDAVSEALWDECFAVNVKAPYFALQALVPLFNPGGVIVLNGSINAHIGMPGSSPYAASKAALVSLAKTLSGDLLGRAIRVNVVSCGPIATPLHGWDATDPAKEPPGAAQTRAQIPLKRFGRPSEVAAAVLYLASADAGFVVGTELIVDGGMSQL